MTEPHSTSLYVPAGRGIISIAAWNGTVPPDPGDFVEIGNCPSLEIEPSQERRPHYSSRAGLRYKDLNPVIQLDYTLTFDIDEISATNLARFFLGSYDQLTGEILGMAAYDQEFAIKFVSNNPIGPNQQYTFHRLTIGPAGPLQLIGDEYLVLNFTADGLADDANNPTSPYMNVKFYTTTTTTTSTTNTV